VVILSTPSLPLPQGAGGARGPGGRGEEAGAGEGEPRGGPLQGDPKAEPLLAEYLHLKVQCSAMQCSAVRVVQCSAPPPPGHGERLDQVSSQTTEIIA
jgi:hypothetical protein